MERRAVQLYNSYLRRVHAYAGTKETWTETLNSMGREVFGFKFKGVYPSNRIPSLTAQNPYCIVNIDKSFQKGSHWLAMAYHNGHIYVYDSFGRKTKALIGKKAWKKNMIDTDYDAEQKTNQDDCGQRCIAWLMVFDTLGPEYAVTI